MFKNMKKVWKYILSILLVIIIAAAGTIYYFLNVKTYDIEDKEIEEIVESDFDIVLPGMEGSVPPTNDNGNSTDNNGETKSNDTKSNSDNSGSNGDTHSPIEEEKGTDSTDNTQTAGSDKSSTSKPNTDTQPGNTTSPPTEVTVKQIKDLYRPVFKSLQSQANGKIDSLVSRAVGEYRAQQSNGESISYSYFYQKYSSAGRELEAKTDGAFNYIYNALEDELKKNGYSTSHAKDFKTQYEASKKERESLLLAKAREAL
jgi:ABC-type cobalt transport system substrate-binding protein